MVLSANRNAEEAATQHVAAMRAALCVRFNGPLLTRLYALTRQKPLHYLDREHISGLFCGGFEKSVVTQRLAVGSVSGVIDALNETPEGQRRWIHTRENLEDFIAGLVVREYIAREATNEHLGGRPVFRGKSGACPGYVFIDHAGRSAAKADSDSAGFRALVLSTPGTGSQRSLRYA